LTGADGLPAFTNSSSVRVSGDGSTIAWSTITGLERWRGGTTAALDAPMQLGGLSANGDVVVGMSGANPARWSSSTGLQLIPALPNAVSSSFAYVSRPTPDGRAFAGSSFIPDLGFRPWKWSEAGGLTPLTALPVGNASSVDTVANTISANGNIVGGFGGRGAYNLLRWDESTLSNLGRGNFNLVIVRDMNASGNVVVGTGFPGALVWWVGGRGATNLQSVLEEDFGLALPDYTMLSADSISDDGRVIVGWMQENFGLGRTFTYRVELPSAVPAPGTAALLVLGGIAATRRRR
jgi:uncharacterized membrane protein